MVAAYSPRVRPGVPVSFPVPWDELDRVTPADFTVRTAAGLITAGARWAGQLPPPQPLPADLVAEGHTIPVARVQAMHEGKRRARARRAAGPGPGPPDGDRWPGRRAVLTAMAPGTETQPAEHQQRDPRPPAGPNHSPPPNHAQGSQNPCTRPCQALTMTRMSSTIGSTLDQGRPARGRGPGRRGRPERAGTGRVPRGGSRR